MIGRTLSLYFAGRFAIMILAMFLVFVALISAVSYFEIVRKVLTRDNYDILRETAVSLLRVPALSEHALPFATLFGAIAAFVTANRRLEIVVARAAGISAWQFLLPAIAVGLLLGILAATVYNPLAVAAQRYSATLKASFHADSYSLFDSGDGEAWLRQAGSGRESIIRADESFDDGLGLIAVTAMVFDQEGGFIERVDAGTARYHPGEWTLENATVTAPGREPARVAAYPLPTMLGPDVVKEAFGRIDGISFWALPKLIGIAESAGLRSDRYRLRYNALLATPVLLIAMVLVAAVVALRFSRSKDLGNMILAGIGVGFTLYIITKIARDLGDAGIVPAALAAWLPAVVSILIGATVLLHLEDG